MTVRAGVAVVAGEQAGWSPHVHSQQQREMNARVHLFSFYLVQDSRLWNGTSYVAGGSSHLLTKPFWKRPHRHTLKDVSMVMLSQAKLTIIKQPPQLQHCELGIRHITFTHNKPPLVSKALFSFHSTKCI